MSDNNTITWFTDSPDTGLDCLCSLCGQPILDMAIRAWDDDNPGYELRFHFECFREVEKSPEQYTPVVAT